MQGITINSDRFRSDFNEIAAIGATPAGGCHRLAFSSEDFEARAWFKQKASLAGLTYWSDEVGNQFASTGDAESVDGVILIGSHLDTVPNGGKFDGTLGVVAALEICCTIKEREIPLERAICAVNFSDEEGAHYGMLGSQAFAGLLTEESLAEPHSGETLLKERLAKEGICIENFKAADSSSAPPSAFLEMHIEQGPILESEKSTIGIVRSIVGIRTSKFVFRGRAAHSGTTPMHSRRDAVYGASCFTKAAVDLVRERFESATLNVGNMQVQPGAFNVVPEIATLSVEIRAGSTSELDDLESSLKELAQQTAATNQLAIEILHGERITPVHSAEAVQNALENAANALELRSRFMHSGAGHDTQSVASICQSGMIFIPSPNGVSHSPEEFSRWEDCECGANVLLRAALELAG